MTDRLRSPRLQTNAARKIRLIDFETGKATLRLEHIDWLEETLRFLPATREFWIDLFGYASKLGFRGVDNPQRKTSRLPDRNAAVEEFAILNLRQSREGVHDRISRAPAESTNQHKTHRTLRRILLR